MKELSREWQRIAVMLRVMKISELIMDTEFDDFIVELPNLATKRGMEQIDIDLMTNLARHLQQTKKLLEPMSKREAVIKDKMANSMNN